MKKSNAWSQFITNNNRYSKYDPEYSRVYLLNISLLVLPIAFLVYGIINIFTMVTPAIFIINFILMAATLLTMIYFHKTNKLEITTIISVILLTLFLSSFIYIVGNDFYGLFWFATYPPYAYFLLGRKKGHIATFVFSLLVFIYIYVSYPHWEPALFGLHSFLNIFGTITCIVLMVIFYEKSNEYAYEALVIKNKELEMLE